jgi:hypothetical protein
VGSQASPPAARGRAERADESDRRVVFSSSHSRSPVMRPDELARIFDEPDLEASEPRCRRATGEWQFAWFADARCDGSPAGVGARLGRSDDLEGGDVSRVAAG